jgi:putrescine transport system ATP-binding protein
MTPLIELHGVSKSFGGVVAVRDVTLAIGAGELFALLGPSGCGKTTLLRLIAGFETPDAGRVLIDGADVTVVPPWRRPVNTVFQSYALFPHMSVAGNIAFGLKQDGLPTAEISRRVAEILALVQLEGLGGRRPAQLSGGQRQRVALARCLVKMPKALLLDEPLAALDRKLRDQMQSELVALQRRVGIAFVFVTHDQDEAMTLSDRLAVMREGAIEQLGPPRAVYERPASRYVADFLGRANIIPGRVAGRDGAFVNVATAGGLVLRAFDGGDIGDGAEVWLAVRPENITFEERSPSPIKEGASRASGTVREATYAGDVSRYAIELGAGLVLRVAVPNRAGEPAARPERGAAVQLSWPADAGVLLVR